MWNRWRGWFAGLAILVGLPLLAAGAGPPAPKALTVRGPDGAVLVSVSAKNGHFTLRYRNSLYASLAEEHYAIAADGTIRLIGLGADELAVLEEYYAIDEPAWRSGAGARAWEAAPARPVELEEFVVAATDLGRRTLLADGREIALWRLVDDAAPSVTLEASAG